MRIGLLIGSVQPPDLFKDREVENTPYGTPSSPIARLESERNSFHVIARHSVPPRIPPHRVDHRANLWVLKQSGVDCIISVCSTGALKREIPIPSLAVPEDYIDLTQGQTFIENEIRHVTPVLDRRIRSALLDSAKCFGIPVRDGGVYVQTRGPRLETRAEVRVISEWGDYVGMNMGSEATLANESDLPFAGLVTINNHANGLTEEEPNYRKILADARSMWETVWSILETLPGDLFDR